MKAVRFTVLGISFGCCAVRIGLTQYRQQQDEETVRRQTLAMDSSIEGIGILNDKGVHSYANSALASILGFGSPERIVGQPWKVVYAFQPIAEIESQVRKGLLESGKWSGNLQLRRPDGTRIPVEFHVARMPDGGTVCGCRDLSQREQAEKARADAETKYRMLVEHVTITHIAEIGINKWYYISRKRIFWVTQEEWLLLRPIGIDTFIQTICQWW